jgi:poly-beta-1,6-N-acetyl-D-glucosamine synthase
MSRIVPAAVGAEGGPKLTYAPERRDTRPGSMPAAGLDSLQGHARRQLSHTTLLPQLRPLGRREVIALVPAHNEEAQIADTLHMLLNQQTRPPDWVVVICDNCTDRTPQIAEALGAKIFRTRGNKYKKAGGLNQALGRILSWVEPTDVILVVDADTKLDRGFIRAAEGEIAAGAGACGGVFYGDQGGGLLGIFQRAEYSRYARQLNRNQGDARVLTGTSCAFTVEALRAVAVARSRDILPGRSSAPGAPVYTTGTSLTEDNEITLALKTLGFTCVSPGDCKVTTEIMPTIGQWWNQRTRWQRGALEDLRTYGSTPVTRSYIVRQCLMGLCVLLFALYVAYAVATSVMYGFHTTPFWLGITSVFVFAQVWTARKAGWRETLVAALVVPELAYDALQHAVWLWCVQGWLRHTPVDW